MTATIVDGNILMFGISKAEAKQLGARWVDSRTAWTLPASRQSAAMIADASIGLPDLREALGQPYEPLDDDRLYEYQRDAAGRLASAPHGLLLVLSPGLGKTAVAVRASDVVVPEGERIVVVAPASLLRTWEREIRKWTTVPGDIYVVQGAIDYDTADKARWIVVSWDKSARMVIDNTWGRRYPLWILDESVLTKSRRSQRYKTMSKMRGRVGRFWLLSGSPTTRYADDLWAQLHLLWPAAFSSYWRFAERYCYVEETPWAKVVTGTRPGKDAAEDNSDLMLVVNQEDVLELPEYLFETIDVDLLPAQRREYERMKKEFVAELGDGTEVIAANEIARLQKLQQITSYWDGRSAKHDTLIDLIDEYEGPHLIWTHWREGAEVLGTRMLAAGYDVSRVSGDTPAKARDDTIEAFKQGRLDVLILSIGVGKFGLTMTNAKSIWWVDKSWNADDFFQATHRVRRIGLKHRPVVITLRAPGTVDELVEDNLEGKLGGISRVTKSRLAELLKGLGR